jgi:hypothetical protein
LTAEAIRTRINHLGLHDGGFKRDVRGECTWDCQNRIQKREQSPSACSSCKKEFHVWGLRLWFVDFGFEFLGFGSNAWVLMLIVWTLWFELVFV